MIVAFRSLRNGYANLVEPLPQIVVEDPHDQPLPFGDELRLQELLEARERLHTLVEQVKGDVTAFRELRDVPPPADT